MQQELDNIRRRYERRKTEANSRYSPLLASVYMTRQEEERALIRLLRMEAGAIRCKSLLEIGCGSGKVLLQLMRLGFRPENLSANELLEDSLELAKRNLPGAVSIIPGDASALELPEGSYDLVYQRTVFSSILDDSFQVKLASVMWKLLKPGGSILWCDFVHSNPQNKDVRGVPCGRIKELFPEGNITKYRITLAPPISRVVTKIHPSLYTMLNVFPFLRTHVLCRIRKDAR